VARIAVISDTHGNLPESEIDYLSNFDEIWHLGDFADPSLLHATEVIGPPVVAVHGNCDYGVSLPEARRLTRDGARFYLVHIPPDQIPDTDFLLHGHTHVPRDERVHGVRILNPGSIGQANRGAPASWGELVTDPSGTVEWKIHLVGQVNYPNS